MDKGAGSYSRYLSGDDTGMAELIRDYRDGLLLYLNSYLNDLSLAEDCVQETFIKLAVKKPVFRGESSFKTWLYTVGRNIAVSAVRKAARRGDVLLDACDALKAETDLERTYLKEEQRITVHRAIRRLNPDAQRVLHLTYFEGFSNAETAGIMHKTKKQIENLLYHARKKLRAELEKEGFDYEEL
ncbi:MAG: RNA polymerase sigma factor [Oscillospiraceae bacterium]|nr:RNA polymerase sigma factor [Oscillospiraceae bacterium]